MLGITCFPLLPCRALVEIGLTVLPKIWAPPLGLIYLSSIWSALVGKTQLVPLRILQYIGMLYWTALFVKFLPSYSELIKSPHSQQVGIFGAHNFMELDGMSHTFFGKHKPKFLYFSLSNY